MPEVECPSCGGFGNVPREKMNDRMVCRKCHAIFHVTRAGRSVMGEPPKVTPVDHGLPHGHPDAVATATGSGGGAFGLTTRQVQMVVGGAALLGLVAYFGIGLLGSGKSLEATARELARQMSAGDNAAVAQASAADSLSDTNLWYQLLRPTLEEMKKNVPDHTLDIAVTERSSGRLAIFFGTEHSSARTSAISKAASPAPMRTSLEVPTYWERDSYGNWRLDGKRTLAVAPTGPGS
jgi:hypothetical protein